MTASKHAILLVHGLGGTSYDLGTLSGTLENMGFATRTPVLPGHGGAPEDLIGVRWQDWVAAIEDAYRALQAQYEHVHLAGVCLGALVATEVARRVALTGTLMLYSPPIYLDGWGLPRFYWARYIAYCLPPLLPHIRVPEDTPYGVKNPRTREAIAQRFSSGDNFHYPYVPLAAIREVDRLRSHLIPRLRELQCKTLVVHAREDEITSLRSAHLLQEQLGERCEMLELKNSYHMIMVDSERVTVLARSREFLKAHALQAEALPAAA